MATSANTTPYIHPFPNYQLNDLHQSMDYNSLGQPVIRTTSSVTNYDAFGRFRTSQPYTLFDSTLRYSDDTRSWDTNLTANGTTVFLANESTMSMNVTTTSGDKVIRQTKRVFIYQPGKSQLTLSTFVFGESKTGLRQRVGLFGSNNGIFLERDGDTTYIVKRSYITGLPVDTRVAQEDWNYDTLDGTGNSAIAIDWTKVQIMWLDIEWLGAGSVRVGFVIDGAFVVAHKFDHANEIDSVYMTTATLPLRLEIENTAGTASNSSMKQICNTVISEGGSSPRVSPRAVSTALAGKACSNTVLTPFIALRLKTSRIDGVAIPAVLNLYGKQNAAFRYAVFANVTVPDGTWVSAGNESHVEYNITSNSYTGGTRLLDGIFGGSNQGGLNAQEVMLKEFNSSLQLARRIDNTAEVFLLAIQATTNNDTAVASMAWEEFN